MKKLLLPLSLILIGCFKEPEPIDVDMLIERDGVFYTKDTGEPYSGPIFYLHPNDDFFLLSDEVTLKDGKPHGLYKEYHKNGQLKEEVTYNNGEIIGPGKQYNTNGQLEKEVTFFKSGKIYGHYKEYMYHDNGQLSQEETYKDGKLDGPGKQYNTNGQLEYEGTFKDGEIYGHYKQYMYHDNGQIWWVTIYNDGGERDGLDKTYNENGQLEYEETYKDGELIESKEY